MAHAWEKYPSQETLWSLFAAFLRYVSVCIGLVLSTGAATADIVTDGSLGAAQSLLGPNVTIPSTLGTRLGNNLFFSFSQFNISAGESAVFNGPAGISNIFSRITGGTASQINGNLSSTIQGADLWFLNPAGIVFGPQAQINVPGSLYVTTAAEIRFQDGNKFASIPSGSSSLSVSAPSAFGFLGTSQGNISIAGTRITAASAGRVFLGARDISIAQGALLTAGDLTLVAVGADAAEIALDGTGPLPALAGMVAITDSPGRATLAGSGLISVRGGSLTLTGATVSSFSLAGGLSRGGARLDARTLTLNDSLISVSDASQARSSLLSINANTFRLLGGSRINLASSGTALLGALTIASDLLQIDGQSTRQVSGIFVANNSTFAGAPSNAPRITATDIQLSNGGQIGISSAGDSLTSALTITAQNISAKGFGGGGLGFGGAIANSGIYTNASGFDTGPAIKLVTNSLFVAESGQITSNARGRANGGDVSISAATATLDGRVQIGTPGIFTNAFDSGAAGALNLTIDNFQILNGGQVASTKFGTQGGGSISITAKSLIVGYDQQNIPAITAGIFTSASRIGGTAGKVTIQTQSLDVIRQGQIDISAGLGGEMEINANSVTLGAGSSVRITAGNGAALQQGPGGSLRIAADNLLITGGSEVRSSTQGSSAGSKIDLTVKNISVESGGVFASNVSSGPGGSISVRAENLSINGSITASASGDGATGAVSVVAKNITLDKGSLSASAVNATNSPASNVPGGNVSIEADSLTLVNGARISSVSSDERQGGQINITVDSLTIDGAGTVPGATTGIFAEARGTRPLSGAGGTITVTADDIDLKSGGLISSGSFGPGAAGAIVLSTNRILSLSDSTVSTTANVASGGQITIDAGAIILRGSSITSTVGGSDGAAGNITLQTGAIVLDNGKIIANAFLGNGGNINLMAQNIIQRGGVPSTIQASSSGGGINGDINLSSPGVNAANGIVALATDFTNTADLLSQSCLQRGESVASSLLSKGRSALPSGFETPASAELLGTKFDRGSPFPQRLGMSVHTNGSRGHFSIGGCRN